MKGSASPSTLFHSPVGREKFGWLGSLGVVAIIGVFSLVAYHDIFPDPFVLDDVAAILENRSIHPGSGIVGSLFPPSATSVTARPVANVTLALNYAVSQTAPWSYHAVNLIILVLGALTLFGVTHRTLLSQRVAPRYGRDAIALALLLALLWSLHPLQTESITYTVQRVESLMGLWLLLTLYSFIRSLDKTHALFWRAASIAFCALGMLTKEVMAVAPILVLLYDRTFVSGSFRSAWHVRHKFYFGLAGTWSILGMVLFASGATRDGSAGFVGRVSPGDYWATQLWAIHHYLRLVLWPQPLVFDYGTFVETSRNEVLISGVIVVILLAVTTMGIIRNTPVGFLGAWLFGILAPTSVIPVVTQTVAEHRMYLPLAAAVAFPLFALYRLWGRFILVLMFFVAVVLCYLSWRRNQIYHSKLSLWGDTVAQQPDNARAHCSLGLALAESAHSLPQAVAQYDEALRLQPDYSLAHEDLGIALSRLPGKFTEAQQQFAEAVRLRPDNANYRTQYGVYLGRKGDLNEAKNQLRQAIELRPDDAEAEFYFANILVQSGELRESIPHFCAALRLRPNFIEAQNNYGTTLFRLGQREEGMAQIDAVIQERPDYIPARLSRGVALLLSDDRQGAIAELQEILRLDPKNLNAKRLLAEIGLQEREVLR